MHQGALRLAVRSESPDEFGRRLSDPSPSGAAGRRPTLDPNHPLFGLGYAQPLATRAFVRLTDNAADTASAAVAEEIPVALVYNGIPHVVMMCTPADIEDFALGFSVSEEIVATAADVRTIAPVRYSQGIEVELTVPAAAAEKLAGRGRALVGRTGCGLCGVTTIDEALRPGRPRIAARRFTRAALFAAGAALPDAQRYNSATGAVHAAAWVAPDGAIAIVREDVGRHNALDKLIGAMLRGGYDPAAGFVLVTSRASYELVQKCAVAGIGVLAAISRPTGLAVRMAEAAGITLVGLVRGRSANVYSHAEGIVEADSAAP